MKHMTRFLFSAALLAIPATGAAQWTGHASIGIGPATPTQPAFHPGLGIGLASHPARPVAYAGLGLSFGLGAWDHPSEHVYGHHGGWDPYDCWDYAWYDPWLECSRYYPPAYLGPWWGWHRPAWGIFGFFGWSSHRVVHHHWYGFPPHWLGGWGWHGGWSWHSGRYGWDWGWDRYRHRTRIRYLHDPYDDRGYATARGYRSGGRATSRGYAGGDRVVRGSPLFGPRYKENPRRAYAADDGPRKRGSRAVPGDGRATGVASGRSGTRATSDDTRRARPRDGAKAATTRAGTRTVVPTTRRTPTRTANPRVTRSTPPKLRTRPEATTRARPTPTRGATPRAKPASPRRPTTVVRPPTTRRPSSTARTPARRPAPKARPATSRNPAPRARPTTRRSPPKVRPAPSKRPAPKPRASASRRPAPKSKASPPRRPPSKPKASAPRRPAPKPKASASRRPPSRPKASPPRRPPSKPKARPPSRRSGGSKPPPRRGGRD